MSVILLWLAYSVPYLIVIIPILVIILLCIADEVDYDWAEAFARLGIGIAVVVSVAGLLALLIWGAVSLWSWSDSYVERHKNDPKIVQKLD